MSSKLELKRIDEADRLLSGGPKIWPLSLRQEVKLAINKYYLCREVIAEAIEDWVRKNISPSEDYILVEEKKVGKDK